MMDIGKTYNDFARNSADLCAFMLVCQYGKLSAAAKHLKVTQPSLSQRIKNLEMVLDEQLFVRTSTGVTMTTAGQTLFHLLKEPLGSAAAQFSEYVERPNIDRVVLSVDHAFASFWLLERLPQLREELGTTDICIITSQDPRRNQGAEADLTVYMSPPARADYGSELLFQEQVSAVCSAAFLQENPGIRTPQDLVRPGVPLLHLKSPTPDTPWIDWSGWLEALGADFGQIPAHTEFNTYEMVVRATRGGQGVALGWHVLIDQLLAEEKLVRPIPQSVQTKVGYYIKLATARQTPKVLDVQKWIVEQASGL